MLAKRDFPDHFLASNYSEGALFGMFLEPVGDTDAFYEQVLASFESLKEYLTKSVNQSPDAILAFPYCDPDHVLDW